jgi:hypothetical protein
MYIAVSERIHLIFSLLAGLPDGFFSNQKSKFGQIFEGLIMEKGWYILWPF